MSIVEKKSHFLDVDTKFLKWENFHLIGGLKLRIDISISITCHKHPNHTKKVLAYSQALKLVKICSFQKIMKDIET